MEIGLVNDHTRRVVVEARSREVVWTSGMFIELPVIVSYEPVLNVKLGRVLGMSRGKG